MRFRFVFFLSYAVLLAWLACSAVGGVLSSPFHPDAVSKIRAAVCGQPQRELLVEEQQ